MESEGEEMKETLEADLEIGGGKIGVVPATVVAANASFQGKEEKIRFTITVPSEGFDQTLEATVVF